MLSIDLRMIFVMTSYADILVISFQLGIDSSNNKAICGKI